MNLYYILIFFFMKKIYCSMNMTYFSQLLTNTFNGFDCININEVSNYINKNIYQTMHTLNYSIRLTKMYEQGEPFCGFVFIGGSQKLIKYFGNNPSLSTGRLLYVGNIYNRSMEFFTQYTSNLFEDMDVLWVNINKNNTNPELKIKSKYDESYKTTDNKKYFFFEKNLVPYNFSYNKPVRLITFNCSIMGSIHNNVLLDGVETKIYKEIEKRLKLKTSAMSPKDGSHWGTPHPNSTISGGILKSLHKRKSDIAFCTIWIESSKYPFIDLSTYWEQACLRFLIPKPKLLNKQWWSIFRPFPLPLWTLTAIATIITSCFCNLIQYVESKYTNIVYNVSNAISDWITILGMLVMAKNPDCKSNNSVNLGLFSWWSIFSLVITTLYSSSLVSNLTYPDCEPMLETVEDLVRAGYFWGTEYETMADKIFDLENPWHVEFAKRFRMEKKPDSRMKRMEGKQYAIFLKSIGDSFFMKEDNIPLGIFKDLRTTRSCLMYYYVGFGYRKSFPLKPVIDLYILRMKESGITNYLLNRMVEKGRYAEGFRKIFEYKIPPEEITLTPLGLRNLQGAFAVLITGLIIAFIIFILEFYNGNRHYLSCNKNNKISKG